MNRNALDFVTSRLLDDKSRSLAYADIVTLITDAQVPFQNQLINALRNQRIQKVGELMNSLIADDLKSKARSDATSILADNILNSAEIDLIFK